jgi:uncharacterized protein
VPLPPCLLLFTKPARAGRVKTRLVGANPAERRLDAADAAALHSALLTDACGALAPGVGPELVLRVVWHLDGDENLPPLPKELAFLPGVGSARQRGSDLGERLFIALADAARTHPLVAAVGSDHPLLDLATVRRAFDALAAGEGDVALGPSLDGGYYLIAVRREALSPRLFADIDWSTERVYRQTRERCEELGLSVVELPVGRDVDRGEDVVALAEEIGRREAAGEAVPCPRTRQVLAGWGLLPAVAERRAACAS